MEFNKDMESELSEKELLENPDISLNKGKKNFTWGAVFLIAAIIWAAFEFVKVILYFFG